MVDIPENDKILAYYRELNDEKFLVVFNNNNENGEMKLSALAPKYNMVFNYRCDDLNEGGVVRMPSYSAFIVKINK